MGSGGTEHSTTCPNASKMVCKVSEVISGARLPTIFDLRGREREGEKHYETKRVEFALQFNKRRKEINGHRFSKKQERTGKSTALFLQKLITHRKGVDEPTERWERQQRCLRGGEGRGVAQQEVEAPPQQEKELAVLLERLGWQQGAEAGPTQRQGPPAPELAHPLPVVLLLLLMLWRRASSPSSSPGCWLVAGSSWQLRTRWLLLLKGRCSWFGLGAQL